MLAAPQRQMSPPWRIFISPAVGPTFGLTQKWAKSQDENMFPPALCVGQLK